MGNEMKGSILLLDEVLCGFVPWLAGLSSWMADSAVMFLYVLITALRFESNHGHKSDIVTERSHMPSPPAVCNS